MEQHLYCTIDITFEPGGSLGNRGRSGTVKLMPFDSTGQTATMYSSQCLKNALRSSSAYQAFIMELGDEVATKTKRANLPLMFEKHVQEYMNSNQPISNTRLVGKDALETANNICNFIFPAKTKPNKKGSGDEDEGGKTMSAQIYLLTPDEVRQCVSLALNPQSIDALEPKVSDIEAELSKRFKNTNLASMLDKVIMGRFLATSNGAGALNTMSAVQYNAAVALEPLRHVSQTWSAVDDHSLDGGFANSGDEVLVFGWHHYTVSIDLTSIQELLSMFEDVDVDATMRRLLGIICTMIPSRSPAKGNCELILSAASLHRGQAYSSVSLAKDVHSSIRRLYQEVSAQDYAVDFGASMHEKCNKLGLGHEYVGHVSFSSARSEDTFGMNSVEDMIGKILDKANIATVERV